MKNQKVYIYIGIAVLTLLLVGGGLYTYRHKKSTPTVTPTQTPQTTKPAPTPPKSTTPVPTSPYYYPMTNFDSRILYRWYGKYVNTSDVVPDCGSTFVGYHNGDDLETTTPEKTTDVPVYAVADGTIRYVSYVSGYGGLLIMQSTINGQTVTLNYGHIRLSSVVSGVGSSVKAGQKLAVLGTGCSTETNGERKHLHFAIHKGTAIDVRGYVPSVAALSDWIDPKALLNGLSANQPK